MEDDDWWEEIWMRVMWGLYWFMVVFLVVIVLSFFAAAFAPKQPTRYERCMEIKNDEILCEIYSKAL